MSHYFYNTYHDEYHGETRRFLPLLTFAAIANEVLLAAMLGAPSSSLSIYLNEAKHLLNGADESDILPWDVDTCNVLLDLGKRAAENHQSDYVMHCMASLWTLLTSERFPINYILGWQALHPGLKTM